MSLIKRVGIEALCIVACVTYGIWLVENRTVIDEYWKVLSGLTFITLSLRSFYKKSLVTLYLGGVFSGGVAHLHLILSMVEQKSYSIDEKSLDYGPLFLLVTATVFVTFLIMYGIKDDTNNSAKRN